MSEINGHNSVGVNQVNQINYLKQNPVSEQPNEVVNDEPVLKDFSDSKAEALGRSLLFKGNDDINNDLKVLMENPQIAENSDKLFEVAYKIAEDNGAENPYEVASEIATGIK
ncbi:hypothetical protein IJO12_04995 [bacterium]|nr:hypothetical protein [bacterium]